jgi:hypothetical protein
VKRPTNKLLILTMIILISLSLITSIQNAKCSTTLIPKIGNTPIIDGVIDLQNDEWADSSKYSLFLYHNLSAPENGLPIDLWTLQDQTSLFIAIQFEFDHHDSNEYNDEFVGILISDDELGDYSDAKLIQFSNMTAQEFQYLDYYIVNSVFIKDNESNGEGAAALDGNKITYEFGMPVEIKDESGQDVWLQRQFTYNISIVYGKTASYPEGILLENNFLIEIQFPRYIPPSTPIDKILFNTIIFGGVGVFIIYYISSFRNVKDKIRRLRS